MFQEKDVCLLKINDKLVYGYIEEMIVRGDASPPHVGYSVRITLLLYPVVKEINLVIADFHMDGREFGVGENRIQFFPVPRKAKEEPELAPNVIKGKFEKGK